jgi:hypothetical protein
MENTIFVQIASYRDPELIPTLKDITNNAAYSENLNIVVNWQHGEDEGIEDFLNNEFDILEYEDYTFIDVDEKQKSFNVINLSYNDANIKLIDVDYTETKGTCWARNLIQQFYNGEKYTLQLDSHHRFVEAWDVKVIDMLESVRTEDTPKPVLTGYIPSYDPENDPEGRVQIPWQTNFDRFIPEGAVFFIPSEMKNWENRDKPQRARFYSGHFCFSDGSFAEDVQHNPRYFFHGEEISIAARAFTHGYDLFTPQRIIAWHEYTRKNRTKVWDNLTTQEVKKGNIEKDWVQRNNECHKLNRILFGMDGEDPSQVDFGRYGFGHKRTLREYEEYAGISFKYRGVQQPTLDQKEPPVNLPYSNEEEWKNSFARSNDIRICVHKNEFPKAFEDDKVLDDIDFCFVGAHDEAGNELHRKDLTGQQFKNYVNSNNGFIDYRFIFLSSVAPSSYTVWPHSKSRGWLDKVVKSANE